MKKRLLLAAAAAGVLLSVPVCTQAQAPAPVEPVFDAIDLKAMTLDGEEIGNEIFQAKDYTMINIWATWCNPCLNELPELAEWEKELPDNVQILYLDYEDAGIASADPKIIQEIIEKTGISGEQVLQCEPELCKDIDQILTAFPTTFFVDSEGNILSDLIIGAQVDLYKEVMNGLLESK